MAGPEEILSFWLDEVEQKDWYVANDALDQTIRDRFQTTWDSAMNGGLGQWLTYSSGTLAYIILLDQFSRNMFRGDGKSYSADQLAVAAAKIAVKKKWDLRIDPPARMFFYTPLMHAENLCDQERCVRLVLERMECNASNLLHARAHREVIRLFGRFPHRNAELGRPSTAAEAAYLAQGGYGATVQELQAA